MKRVKPTDKHISPNQRRLRLMELSGIPLTEIQKKRLLSESVSMILPPLKHERDRVQKSMIWNGNDISDIEDEVEEGEVDLDEILHELGYYDDEESDDLREDFTDEVEEDDSISNMSREELKQMIQNIVLDTMEEEDDLNEIIENITKT
jgi:enoyl-[acyl-carrier-protein] reductase (NADH)